MITLQTRPIHLLRRTDIWHASPSLSSSSPSSSLHESFHHSCLGLSDSCPVCCRRKPLSNVECRWSNVQGNHRRKISFNRILTVYATDSVVAVDSVAALPERLTENAELNVCRDYAEMATLPELIQSFAASNGSLSVPGKSITANNGASLLASKEEGEEEEEKVEDALMVPSEDAEGTQACLQPSIDKDLLGEHQQVTQCTSSLFSEQDAPTSISEQETRILEQEKLRRKRISEANKNKVPWNKGKKYMQGMPSNSAAATKDITVVDNDAVLLIKEKQRRQRIAAANAGKVPWNKGRQHSEETRQRIRERTTEAMKNPKIREKLRVHGSMLSSETRSKISAALVLLWGAKKKLKQIQETCVEEWQEHVADAARRGYGGDVEYNWNSYETIFRELQYAWRSKRKGRRRKESRVPMTSAHRIKISNAIKAKWADLNYRSNVEAAIHAHWEKQGAGQVEMKGRRRHRNHTTKDKQLHDAVVLRSTNSESDEINDNLVPNADDTLGIGSELLQSIRNVLPAYRNPLNNEMLEKLKQIRAMRRSKETNRRRALERARILMAEAQMAARALEAQAATDESALPPLQEAQQLLAEAAESFKAAGFGADFFLEPSEGE